MIDAVDDDRTPRFDEPACEAPSLEPGARIGRYVVQRTLGRGGMGVVLLAHDERLDRKVAIKLLRARDFGTDRDAIARARLVREAQAMALLSHPNVITVHDVGSIGGRVYVAMEFVEGVTLRRWLREAPRSQQEILRCFIAAGRGLAAAHGAGLVHRDFKPDNVMIGAGSDAGRVLVLDFGLARPPDAQDSTPEAMSTAATTGTSHEIAALTLSGWVLGTPLYMAPEQHGGQAVPASDQFALCVALYEAVFGQRPFAGDSVEELAAAKHGQHLREMPPGRGVSVHLRRTLRRGLAAAPEQRFASMTALVDALAHDPRPARRRLAIGAGVLACTAVLSATVVVARSDRGACTRVDAALDGIWDATRRDEVAQALTVTASTYADATTSTVLSGLDDYANALLAAQRANCEAMAAAQPVDGPELDHEISCLQRRRQGLAAMVDVLATADAAVGERAVDAMLSLPAVDGCAAATSGAGASTMPTDPAILERIEAGNAEASRVAALLGAGRYDDAKSAVVPLLVEAAAIGHLPLLAEAELLSAEIESHRGEPDPAIAAYLRATDAAAAGGDDRLAARAWIGLLYTAGHTKAQHGPAIDYARHAEVALHRIGEPADLEAELASTRGMIAHDQGDYPAAQALHERALALRESQGAAAVDGSTLVNLARTLAARGEIGRAREHVLRAIDIIEVRYGPQHPTVARTLTHLGSIEFEAGEYAAAKGRYERALAIQEASLGPRHPEVAFSLNNVANTLVTERRLDEALDHYGRAREILREKLGDEHPNIARLTFNMAELAKQAGQRERSKAEYRVAIGLFERTLGADHPELGRGYNNLASVQYDNGEAADALANYTTALRISEQALGRDHPDLAYPLTGVGLAQLALDAPARAIEPLERAVALRRGSDIDPVDRADAQFALARALWDGGGDRGRAITLADDAIAGYAKAQEGYPTARDEATKWRAEHHR